VGFQIDCKRGLVEPLRDCSLYHQAGHCVGEGQIGFELSCNQWRRLAPIVNLVARGRFAFLGGRRVGRLRKQKAQSAAKEVGRSKAVADARWPPNSGHGFWLPARIVAAWRSALAIKRRSVFRIVRRPCCMQPYSKVHVACYCDYWC
jgi:hypothetical protein